MKSIDNIDKTQAGALRMMEPKEKEERRALTIAEAAHYACVSRGTVENWLCQGLLPYEELPSRGNGSQRFRRIRMVDLVKFLDEHYRRQIVRQQTISQRDENGGSAYTEMILLPKK